MAKIKGIGFYKNNKLNGIVKTFYKSGALSSEFVINNGNILKFKTYYENGKINSISNYKNNKLNGKSIVYYESGNIASIINYKNGDIKGEFIEFYPNKKIKFRHFYK